MNEQLIANDFESSLYLYKDVLQLSLIFDFTSKIEKDEKNDYFFLNLSGCKPRNQHNSHFSRCTEKNC